MANKGRFEITIVAHEKIRDLALDPNFFDKVQELTQTVQNRHGVTLYAAQQSLFMARRVLLHPEHDVRPLPNIDASLAHFDKIKSAWNAIKGCADVTIGDVYVSDKKIYHKQTNEEVIL